MYRDIKWLRLTPDRMGRGGSKTGIHSFQQEPVNDTRILSGGHIYQGAWRRDFNQVTPSQGLDTFAFLSTYAIHGYVYPSLTDPAAAPSVTMLGYHRSATGNGTRVWDFATGLRQSRTSTSALQTGVFQTIGGRCYFVDGNAEGLLMDDRTPAIHAQPNQNIGIGTPAQAMSPLTSSGVSPYGTGYLYNGSHYCNHPNPNNLISTILTTDTVAFSLPNISITQYSGVVIPQASPTTAGVSSNTVAFAAAGTISITSGTSLVTLAGSTWPAGYQYAGLAINFNGYSFVIAEHGNNPSAYTLDGAGIALSNVELLILGVYNGPTITGSTYTITGSQFLMPGANSSARVTNFGTLGYSQFTFSNLVQVQLLVLTSSTRARNLGNISLSGASDTTSTGGNLQSITDASMLATKKNLISLSGPFVATDVGSPIAVDKAGAAGTTLITKIKTFVDLTEVQLESANISGVNVVAGKAWWGAPPTITDGVMDNNVTFNLTSASNPFAVGDVGRAIIVEGAAAGPSALITTIATYVSAGNVTLALKNTSGGAISGKRAWWRAIPQDAHTGPSYAYAWCDPETGHMSNISPLYQIPKPNDLGTIYNDFANITPVFRVDKGYISYPSATDAVRFSHIVFFRTLSATGSSTLYPIGSLAPYTGKVHPGSTSTRGTWTSGIYGGWQGIPNNYVDAPPSVPANINLWYDFSSDSDLLLSGGFRAPQFTNEKPMVLLRGGITQPGYPYQLAFWDRRTWLVNTQEPDKVAFSCDEAQCPLGLPEESFPPTNYLRIPSTDGQVTGMRTVGEMLLITTQRLAYVIAGNNESNYRLMKVSSSMPGVGTYQMEEFPTYAGAEGEPTTVFFLARDRKVYRWTIGGQVVPVSQQIQDQLDLYLSNTPQSTSYSGSRLHCVSAWGRRLVVVSPYVKPFVPPLSLGGYPAFIYDIDTQTWSSSLLKDGYAADDSQYRSGPGPPMATIYGSDPPVNEVYSMCIPAVSGQAAYFSWLRDDQTTISNPFAMTTFPLNFDGKKTRKQLVAVNIHATASASWTLTTTVNEAASSVNFFAAYPDPLDSIYGPGATPVDGGLTDTVVLAAQFAAGVSTPLVGYRFILNIQNGSTTPLKLYAVDVGYVDYEEPGEGDP